MNERILVVAAHPDDETLGCGGTLAWFHSIGYETFVVNLADGVTSRQNPVQSAAARRRSAERAMSILGVTQLHSLGYGDQRLDKLALSEVANAIEELVYSIRPTTVITHSLSDLNLDHRIALEATLVACRPAPQNFVRKIISFEVPSSTGWFPGAPSFDPRYFVDVSLTLDRKLAALGCFGDELRPWPHARSTPAIEALARMRGSSVGLPAAEAFEVLRWLDGSLAPEVNNA